MWRNKDSFDFFGHKFVHHLFHQRKRWVEPEILPTPNLLESIVLLGPKMLAKVKPCIRKRIGLRHVGIQPHK
jgi:hypothetical protein